MISIFSTNCVYNCWECSRQCEMKTAMEELSEEQFKMSILSNAKMQAGMCIASGHMNAQTSKKHVETTFMSLVCARQKYLETLKN